MAVQALHVDQEDGRQAGYVSLLAWREAERDFAKSTAYLGILIAEAEPEKDLIAGAVALFGESLATDLMNWLEQGKRLYRVSRMLDRKQAALIAWEDQDSAGVMNIGVIDVEEIPAGGELSLWPFVIIGAGVAIGTVLLVKYWTHDVSRLREETKRIVAETNAKIVEVATQDPDLARRIYAANTAAMEAALKADNNPGTWLGRLFKGIGGAGGYAAATALPWALLAFAWFASTGGTKRKKNPAAAAVPAWMLFNMLSGDKRKPKRRRAA